MSPWTGIGGGVQKSSLHSGGEGLGGCWDGGVTPLFPPCPPPSFTICHKTEVVRNTLNPVWAAFAIPVRALCNGDHDR